MKKKEPECQFVERGEVLFQGSSFAALMRETLGRGGAVRFRAEGLSMAPFIRHGDVLTVVSLPPGPPRLGDVLAMAHSAPEGLLVHRVIRRRGAAVALKGDNCLEEDGLFPKEAILGCITAAERGSEKVFLGLGPERVVIAALSKGSLLRPVLGMLAKILRLIVGSLSPRSSSDGAAGRERST